MFTIFEVDFTNPSAQSANAQERVATGMKGAIQFLIQNYAQLEIMCNFYDVHQWFPTMVLRHTRVQWAGARGAANSYNSLIFIWEITQGCSQISLIPSKGAANQKRLGNTAVHSMPHA